MSLLCVGSVAYDVIELPGKEPVEVLGGSATWFAAAASLFTRPSLVGVVGEDFLEDDMAFLEGRGVDTSGLVRKAGRTFRWHGRYHDDMKGRDSLKTELGVFAEFSPVIPKALRNPDVLFLGNIEPSLQGLVMAQASGARLVGLDTIEIWLGDGHRSRLERLLPKTDLFYLNDDELLMLSGERTIMAAADKLLDTGVGSLVVKKGEHGATLFTQKAIRLFPAFPVASVIDPTGAGDCFAGGSLGYLDLLGEYDGDAIVEALAVGTVVASFCVEGFGPKSFERVTPSLLLERITAYGQMVGFDAERVRGVLKG
ncbi:MAG: sugar kinase [Deltaproteobacteria bacterium]|nr:sugar kinase [Deltaproteobacteria bacterium]